MGMKTPVYDGMMRLCASHRWKHWAGYLSVCSYDFSHDREYYAFRETAGLIDVSPLFKYEVSGPDVVPFLKRLLVRDIASLKPGGMTYVCWCDDDGYVVDDGTVFRVSENCFRIQSADPSYSWFSRVAYGFNVTVTDRSRDLASLSVQGPRAREVVAEVTAADGTVGVRDIGFFKGCPVRFESGGKGFVTRTGYTGDLGYELWVDRDQAMPLWDALLARGRKHGLEACGLDAMDVCRVEAGYILNGVDYQSSLHLSLDSRKSTPYEIGLGARIDLDRDFVGAESLRRKSKNGRLADRPETVLVGLEVDWDDFERAHRSRGVSPEICTAAWRKTVPIFGPDDVQIGYASSGTWSPILKKNIALAHVRPEFQALGETVGMQIIVEHELDIARCKVVKTPFFDPERKRGSV